jgi:hypothetical protein
MSFDYDVPSSRIAVFRPKRMDDLRPGIERIIGKVFVFDYAGTSNEDEPSPGQRRWQFSRQHDSFLGEFAALWVPEEDLEEPNAN